MMLYLSNNNHLYFLPLKFYTTSLLLIILCEKNTNSQSVSLVISYSLKYLTNQEGNPLHTTMIHLLFAFNILRIK